MQASPTAPSSAKVLVVGCTGETSKPNPGDQGPDNVHMTASGYTHIKELFQVWLKGGSSWFNPPAMALHTLSDGTVANDYNYLTCERDRDWVYIQGSIQGWRK